MFNSYFDITRGYPGSFFFPGHQCETQDTQDSDTAFVLLAVFSAYWLPAGFKSDVSANQPSGSTGCWACWWSTYIKLVGGLDHLDYFSIQLVMSSSQLLLTHSFQRGRAQPPTRNSAGWNPGPSPACLFLGAVLLCNIMQLWIFLLILFWLHAYHDPTCLLIASPLLDLWISLQFISCEFLLPATLWGTKNGLPTCSNDFFPPSWPFPVNLCSSIVAASLCHSTAIFIYRRWRFRLYLPYGHLT